MRFFYHIKNLLQRKEEKHMNKTFKKALAVLLAVFMVAGFVPFVDIAPTTASAAVSTWN